MNHLDPEWDAARPLYERDAWKCRYCDLNGSVCFESWLTLTSDHLLPRGHQLRDDLEFVVTACNWCNNAAGVPPDEVEGRTLDQMTREEIDDVRDVIIEERRRRVLKKRMLYHEHWTHAVSASDRKRWWMFWECRRCR